MLASTGTVAFAVITLLPVELILQVSSGAGFAMVFALLIAAIVWNLSTWWFGLPASSSHTMVGSIIGVGIANQLMNVHSGHLGRGLGAGHQGSQGAAHLAAGRLCCAALLFLLSKQLIKYPSLYEAPKDNQPPPWPIRALMVLTCTGVSFFHGSNDGQKGMGLIMLILIGTVPTAYALNHAVTASDIQQFIAASEQAGHILDRHVDESRHPGPGCPRRGHRLHPHQANAAGYDSGAAGTGRRSEPRSGALQGLQVGSGAGTDQRPQRYVCGQRGHPADAEEQEAPVFNAAENKALANYKSKVDKATKFIPDWVKVAVALALGLGTMVGWKRVVVTVGEKIGKEHLTYAQGASAGLVAMGTIFAADTLGLPVSTTHILSSGVAGTMTANGSGLRLVHGPQYRRRLGLYAAGRRHALRRPLLALPGGLLSLGPCSGLGAARLAASSCRVKEFIANAPTPRSSG